MILLDTHAMFWALADPKRLSRGARMAISEADRVAVASITWYELAWLLDAGRIEVESSAEAWLRQASGLVETLTLTWEIAHDAAARSRHRRFPTDPADRVIYGTAVVHGLRLVTRDQRLRDFDAVVCVW